MTLHSTALSPLPQERRLERYVKPKVRVPSLSLNNTRHIKSSLSTERATKMFSDQDDSFVQDYLTTLMQSSMILTPHSPSTSQSLAHSSTQHQLSRQVLLPKEHEITYDETELSILTNELHRLCTKSGGQNAQHPTSQPPQVLTIPLHQKPVKAVAPTQSQREAPSSRRDVELSTPRNRSFVHKKNYKQINKEIEALKSAVKMTGKKARPTDEEETPTGAYTHRLTSLSSKRVSESAKETIMEHMLFDTQQEQYAVTHRSHPRSNRNQSLSQLSHRTPSRPSTTSPYTVQDTQIFTLTALTGTGEDEDLDATFTNRHTSHSTTRDQQRFDRKSVIPQLLRQKRVEVGAEHLQFTQTARENTRRHLLRVEMMRKKKEAALDNDQNHRMKTASTRRAVSVASGTYPMRTSPRNDSSLSHRSTEKQDSLYQKMRNARKWVRVLASVVRIAALTDSLAEDRARRKGKALAQSKRKETEAIKQQEALVRRRHDMGEAGVTVGRFIHSLVSSYRALKSKEYSDMLYTCIFTIRSTHRLSIRVRQLRFLYLRVQNILRSIHDCRAARIKLIDNLWHRMECCLVMGVNFPTPTLETYPPPPITTRSSYSTLPLITSFISSLPSPALLTPAAIVPFLDYQPIRSSSLSSANLSTSSLPSASSPSATHSDPYTLSLLSPFDKRTIDDIVKKFKGVFLKEAKESNTTARHNRRMQSTMGLARKFSLSGLNSPNIFSSPSIASLVHPNANFSTPTHSSVHSSVPLPGQTSETSNDNTLSTSLLTSTLMQKTKVKHMLTFEEYTTLTPRHIRMKIISDKLSAVRMVFMHVVEKDGRRLGVDRPLFPVARVFRELIAGMVLDGMQQAVK
ncbi:hypothetical protein BLNAU_9008 [Blattamonas nauphoetae]|uniref:Uncharacterized protein n=1 Tax=Blattamonas nauphoetae TaxID=2049346 RepID=A0ABQ9XX38_9EUKA|nr:hypothetical protein BLNAU_9008 [Blattamonas nauphoetae]